MESRVRECILHALTLITGQMHVNERTAPLSALQRSHYTATWVRVAFNILCQGNEMHKKVLFSVSGQREMNSGDFAIYCLC